MKKYILILALGIFSLIFCTTTSKAQSFTDGLHIGAKFGASQYLGESGSEISGRLNEFENSFGTAYDLEISKYLNGHLELGIEIGSSTLKGNTDNPDFSAEGFHYTMVDGIDDPVEYENQLLSQKAFLSYYLRDLGSEGDGVYINPFIRAGIGHLIYKARFKYQGAPDDELIFGKGVNDHNPLTSAVFTFGGGFKASLTENISVMASVVFNQVRSDFLDVVYNYSSMGERLELNGMYSEFKLGLFYSFGNISGGSNKKSGGSKSRKNGGGRSSKTSGTNLPFAPSR